MPKLSERGVIQVALILLLLVGIGVGVYLVQQKTNIFSKAAVSKPIGPETSFTLVGPNDCAAGWLCVLQFRDEPRPGEEFEVKLYVRSDIDEANLFQARMKFPASLVEVSSIKTDGSFIKNWVENYYDNSGGQINLTGGVPAPGFQTKFGGESTLMATIVFKAKVDGKGTVSFNDDSAIYRNTDNQNILQVKRDYEVSISIKPPPPSQEIICNDISLNVSPNTSNIAQNINFTINGDGSTFVGDSWSGGVSGCGGAWNSKTCTAQSAGSFTWTHTWRHCVGDFDHCSPLCSKSAPFQVQGLTPPPGNKGDGNKDGKINLVDMSILLTDFNKEQGFREPIDMNGDGKINTFDFSLHRKLLIDTGIIKGQ